MGQRVLRGLNEVGDVERAVVFDIQPPDVDDPRVAFYQTDLTQPGVESEMALVMQENGVNVFLHAAFLWNSVRDANWAHELESVGTDRVLAAVLSAGVRRLVVTSTVTVYGVSHRNATPLTEKAPLFSSRTLPPWRDKVSAEMAVNRFAEAHPEVCVTVIRSAILLDAHLDRAISRTLRGRFIPTLMGFDPHFQFLHPDDLFEVYRRAIREDHPGVFNVAPEDVVSLREVIRAGGKVAVPLPHVLAIPAYRFLWSAGIGEVHPSFLNFLRFSLVVDGARARAEFGFTPRSTKETVKAFFAAVSSSPPAPEKTAREVVS